MRRPHSVLLARQELSLYILQKQLATTPFLLGRSRSKDFFALMYGYLCNRISDIPQNTASGNSQANDYLRAKDANLFSITTCTPSSSHPVPQNQHSLHNSSQGKLAKYLIMLLQSLLPITSSL